MIASTMKPTTLLQNLNPSQHASVTSPASQLAILAGPGSGKTHTLTSRTAYLLTQGLQPWNIIVATFTVKAAREMKERIGRLLGNGTEEKLILGTFHSIARRYLARYGYLVGVGKGFGIADSADSLAIVKRAVKRYGLGIDAKVARMRISGQKARGAGYKVEEEESAKRDKSGRKTVEMQEFEVCYREYEEALKRSNLLDYDDLLLRCVDLLRQFPSCVRNVESVLIDEFQDTNLVQFDLMRLFAAEKKMITIVGDPDQSIYGFRAAEVKNYRRLLSMYPDTVTIALEENYRSSGAILLSALSVIEQDSSRVAKSLLATHTVGTRPVLRKLANADKEAEWIITEIRRIKGMTGDLLDLNDFAILLRSAALSRVIESALGKAGIAYRMVGGLRFYDRIEIKTVLDYLRVINQPDNNDALARIINVPSRRIGDATIKSLLEEADQSEITLWTLILSVMQGKRTAKTKILKATDSGLSKFVKIILDAQSKLTGKPEERISTPELIKFILLKTNYEEWLDEHYNDKQKGKAKWANVEELIQQATDFQGSVSHEDQDESLPQISGIDQEEGDDHLSKFLANVALASEVKKDEETTTAQVTISTIHAAKGLEWPVVFVPAAYEGSIPHSRAEDTNEERRLLYVAMTRAKALLYMSCPSKNSQSEATKLSPFLPASLKPLLDERGPSLNSSTVTTMAQILRRALPSAISISQSSESLPSTEDNLWPLNGEEDPDNKHSRWNQGTEYSIFTTDHPALKRQKIDLGRSVSNPEAIIAQSWKPSYPTTMDQAASSTIPSVASKTGFVSANSHLQVLKGQQAAIEPVADETPKKRGSKAKLAEGQNTLLSFLGKAEPVVPLPKPLETRRSQPPNVVLPPTFSHARSIAHLDKPVAIEPALSTHRLGSLKRTHSRLRTTGMLDPDSENGTSGGRNAYCFLSSSPPRKVEAEAVIIEEIEVQPEEAPLPPKTTGLSTRPPLMKYVRPSLGTSTTSSSSSSTVKSTTGFTIAGKGTIQGTNVGASLSTTGNTSTRPTTSVSMHQTSMDKLNSNVGKKTLGMRRSVVGWENRPSKAGGGFKPPSRMG